jgi:ribosome-associated protein
MIPITHFIAIDEREIVETFIRASGPGGQHVNTTASAVQLRFDALGSPNLPDDLKSRLRGVAGSRMTQDGTIVITAESFRSQGRNREDALERLVALLREAAVRKPVRRATRPTLASKKRRLEAKGRRSAVKADRRSPTD